MNLSSVMYKAWSKVDKQGLQDKASEALRNWDYETIRQIRESTGILPREVQQRLDSEIQGGMLGLNRVRPLMEATFLQPSRNAIEKGIKSNLREGNILFLDNLSSLGVPYTIPQAEFEEGLTTLIYHRDFKELQQLGPWTERLPSQVLQQGFAAYAKEGWSKDIETLARTLGKAADPHLIHQAEQRARELQEKNHEHRDLFGSLQIDSWFCVQPQECFKDSEGVGPDEIRTYSNVYHELKLGKDLDYLETFDFFGLPNFRVDSLGSVFLYLTRDQHGYKLQACLDKTYRERMGPSGRLGFTQFAAAGPREDLQKALDTFEEYPKSIRTFLQTICHWEQKPIEANLVERMEHLYLYDEAKGKRHYHFCPDSPR